MVTKKTLLTILALGIAFPVSAQNDESILDNLFIQTGVGYLEETEEPYYTGSIGFDGGCGNKWFLSYGYSEQTLFSGTIGTVTGKVEETTQVLALGATFGFPVGDNGNFFYGASVGVAKVEVTARGTDGVDSFRLSVDDTVLYADVTMGIEHSFTEHVSLVGQVRYIYIDDYEFSYGGGSVTSRNDQFAFELGLKINF